MSSGCVIGVDLGGTKVLAGAVDAGLHVSHRSTRPAAGGSTRDVLDRVTAAVREVADAVDGPVDAVGFGIPSLIDQARGIAVFTNHLPIAELPFRAEMVQRLGLPVLVDNDANVALLVEHRHGAAAGAEHAVLLTIGTGIGGALVVNGELVRGATGAAAELGHVTVALDGPPCPGNCPNRGCLESVASGLALGRLAIERAEADPGGGLARAREAGRTITGPLVTELAQAEDAGAVACVAQVGRMLGVGIASFVNVFNPEVVVVGGGVSAAGELLLAPARAEVAARALSPSKDVVRIVEARFGAEAGMLGAAVLAMDATS